MLNGTSQIPAYWKNGVVVKLSTGTKDDYVSAIAVDEDNTVHLAGYQFTTFNHTIARYWNSNGISTNISDGSTANIGLTRVGYKIQIGALQEAANDYSNRITYVCTPTF